VPPVLLDVLAVVTLWVCQSEQPLLQPVVAAVPHRDGEVEEPEAVAQATDPVLAPSVCAAVRMLEREGVPGVPVGGVVLPDGPPLPPSEIRTPQAPRVEVVG